MEKNNFKQLSDIVSKTLSLLKDPHPGLSTWNDFLSQNGKAFQEIAAKIDAAPAPAAKDGLDLNELRTRLEQLSTVLKDKQFGVAMWQKTVAEQVSGISAMFSSAGIKPTAAASQADKAKPYKPTSRY